MQIDENFTFDMPLIIVCMMFRVAVYFSQGGLP